MPPAQRIRLLVTHLESAGWTPTIFTVDSKFREDQPDEWMTQIAGGAFKKIEVFCLKSTLTRKFGVGDLGLRMYWGLRKEMLRQIKIKRPDFVLYPVPPWYIMIMAPGIHQLTKIPYAIDFIDPWVHKIHPNNLKARVSQWLARKLEKKILLKSCAIFAVSQGILDDLCYRYPELKSKPLIPLPYGVEPSDYDTIKPDRQKVPNHVVLIRYVGAISVAMLPVVETLIQALTTLQSHTPIQVEFIGTNYAAGAMAIPVLKDIVQQYHAQSFIYEMPERVGYKKALELSKGADLQLLIGDITPYYAASKLMGMVTSGYPFFAFVHQGSFPDQFLTEIEFENKITFTRGTLSDSQLILKLADQLLSAISNKNNFRKIPADHPILSGHSAKAMTQKVVDTLNQLIP